jgi:predicted GH43/DUF377 family glycosyl hydrolase
MMQLAERKSISLIPDLKRVLFQFFDLDKLRKSKNILNRIKSLPESTAADLVDNILSEFKNRHRNFEKILLKNYSKVELRNSEVKIFSEKKRMLLGAYYSNEYSLEAAALMNPSMVMYPEVENNEAEKCPFIMSLRSVGEGHISSLQFRTGSVDGNGKVEVDPVSEYTNAGNYKKVTKKNCEITELTFSEVNSISERVIFPMSPDECNGIEDVRFVRFESDTYYGTYAAYDGYKITLKLIETRDFKSFSIQKLMDGSFSHKGVALFPRKVDDKYLMTSRQDGENLYIMYSDDILKWDKAYKIMEPKEPWEFIQLGNCGSPLEIEQGWILITHGVGPMRKYVLSACLLDKNDPSKIIAKLDQPLLSPLESERNGYVPNVVYSCGAMLYKNEIYIPYAMSDYASSIASISVHKLLEHMQ